MPDAGLRLRAPARRALAARLREELPPDALHLDGEHARSFADALVPTL
ncbi:MAG: hypothetical protein JWM31_946, partial [Solirubrobacterales bacterium]|nr:hypothetical protein [Solirubrobacterales bacterium]